MGQIVVGYSYSTTYCHRLHDLYDEYGVKGELTILCLYLWNEGSLQ